MDPLKEMCCALVSINQIFEKRKEYNEDNVEREINSNLNKKQENSSFALTTTTDIKEDQNNRLSSKTLTIDNFYRARLCNRTIDELPNINMDEIKRLKLINVNTIQDLLGRYLIHDTPEEFYAFLLQTYHFNEKTALTMTHLFHQWTQYNLDGIKMDEQRNLI